MNNKTRALALFSGGLDSALAIRVIKEQDIDVVALNFVSYFFGGNNLKAENMAKQLDVPLEYVEFQKEHLAMMHDPVAGFGKHLNPCIDCHALMFKTAGQLLDKFNAQFLISGEVLGQRPMSQNYTALERVRRLSGVGDIIVRPMSGKLLPSSKPIEDGLVNKDMLLDIYGRSRQRQLELVKHYGIVDYATPGGGCLLTDPSYSRRLSLIRDDALFEPKDAYLFELIKNSRFFRLSPGKYFLVGKDDTTNKVIAGFKNSGNLQIRANDVPGPRIMLVGKMTPEDMNLAFRLFSRYAKTKGAVPITAVMERPDGEDEVVQIPAVDIAEVQKVIDKYLIT